MTRRPNEVTGAHAGERLGFAGKSRVGLSPPPGAAEFRRSVNTTRAVLLLLVVTMCSCTPKTPKDAAEAALSDAKRLPAEGKFEQALQKHVWFHNHALEMRR